MKDLFDDMTKKELIDYLESFGFTYDESYDIQDLVDDAREISNKEYNVT